MAQETTGHADNDVVSCDTMRTHDTEYMTAAQLARTLPEVNGKRIAPRTVRRWVTDGVSGHRLEGRRLGRRLIIERAAFDKFVENLSHA